jgi:hypothetical protein
VQPLNLLRVALILVLLVTPTALVAAGAGGGGWVHVKLVATVGADGYTVVSRELPYSTCRLVGVKGWSWKPSGKPVLLAFTPNPSLWKKLMATPLLPPQPQLPVRIVEGPSGVYVYATLPGAPGRKVELELECLGSRSSTTGDGGQMVIIVPDNPVVERYAESIADIHEAEGFRVRVVRLSQLAGIEPAPAPPDVCKPGRGDAPDYNLTLALKIIAFLRAAVGQGVRYVLIIGGASEVPPVYVCSPILYELVNPKEAIVPTDYYYADPNYDGYVELAVGRIPTTDPFSLQEYVDALEKWVKGGEWQHGMLVGGGAPFATTLMIGEAAAEEAYTLLHRVNASVGIIALSLGNYLGQSFSQYLGSYGLYYLVSHGAGNAMLDYVPGGLWNYDFELKLTSSTAYSRKPMVFLTPACRVGFWDYDLVEPPFIPPSIGVKLVTSGSAVAFIGYSRIAVETITSIEASEGRVSVRLGGADAPLLMFLRQLQDAPTLGEAWRRALNAYLISPDSHYVAFLVSGEEEIGHLVSREAVFLGDPAAPNPWRSSSAGGGWQPPEVEPPEGSVWVGSTLIAMPLAKYAKGYIPAYNPAFNTTVELTVNGSCPTGAASYAIYRVEGYVFIGYVELNTTTVESGNGTCTVRLSIPYDAPSLVRTVLLYDRGAAVYYMLVGGAAASNGTLLLRGLDALETLGDEVLAVYVNGRPATVVAGGATFYQLNVSGGGVVAVRPLHRYDVIYGGEKVAGDMAKLLKLYQANVTAAERGLWRGKIEFTAGSTTSSGAAGSNPLTACGGGSSTPATPGEGGGGSSWWWLPTSYAVAVGGLAAALAVVARRR